jgi:hypothetical protein
MEQVEPVLPQGFTYTGLDEALHSRSAKGGLYGQQGVVIAVRHEERQYTCPVVRYR